MLDSTFQRPLLRTLLSTQRKTTVKIPSKKLQDCYFMCTFEALLQCNAPYRENLTNVLDKLANQRA